MSTRQFLKKRIEANIPVARYKCYEHFLESSYTDDCEKCMGYGRYTKDTADPVEGHKFSNYIKCEGCEGTGKAPHSVVRGRYKKWLITHKRNVKKYEKRAKLAMTAIEKLSDKELTALYDISTGRVIV